MKDEKTQCSGVGPIPVPGDDGPVKGNIRNPNFQMAYPRMGAIGGYGNEGEGKRAEKRRHLLEVVRCLMSRRGVVGHGTLTQLHSSSIVGGF